MCYPTAASCKSGGKDLALELEETGYAGFEEEAVERA